jgi:lysophospholipid acyltransferase (LPLAT)-like uncharacterized protein
VVLISEHRDGELIARLVERRGFRTARGVEHAGAARAGSATSLRALRGGADLALTPDGPQGPPRRLKPGVLVAAQRSGAPLIPVAVGARRAWRVRSWDRFLVPHPFATIEAVYGAPIFVPRDARGEALNVLAARVDAEVNRLTDQVDRDNPDPVRPVEPWTPDAELERPGPTAAGRRVRVRRGLEGAFRRYWHDEAGLAPGWRSPP